MKRMMKGIAQNVIPYADRWAVYESRRPDTLHFFDTLEEAMDYARERALICEAPVLLHSATPAHEDAELVAMDIPDKADIVHFAHCPGKKHGDLQDEYREIHVRPLR